MLTAPVQADAARIVRYSKYPPIGSRGYGPLFTGHSFPGVTPAVYDSEADQSLVVAVQIESQSGVDNVEEIAKVEGLDVLLIGERRLPGCSGHQVPYRKLLMRDTA